MSHLENARPSPPLVWSITSTLVTLDSSAGAGHLHFVRHPAVLEHTVHLHSFRDVSWGEPHFEHIRRTLLEITPVFLFISAPQHADFTFFLEFDIELGVAYKYWVVK